MWDAVDILSSRHGMGPWIPGAPKVVDRVSTGVRMDWIEGWTLSGAGTGWLSPAVISKVPLWYPVARFNLKTTCISRISFTIADST